MNRLRIVPLTLTAALSACAHQPSSDAPAARAATAIVVPTIERPKQESAAWWFTAGAAAAHANVGTTPPRAKDVIVFLGDGMSIPTIAASHILAGQRAGVDGESYRLSFETLPYTALSRTYETDSQTPDSAGTMTAIMSGVKTKSGFIGISQAANRGDCASSKGHELVSALELAESAGMATGAVTTISVTADHAHTMTFSGYPVRGNPILGLVRGGSDFEGASDALALDQLGLPYTTIGYANGPGYQGATDRQPAGPKTYPHSYTSASANKAGPFA